MHGAELCMELSYLELSCAYAMCTWSAGMSRRDLGHAECRFCGWVFGAAGALMLGENTVGRLLALVPPDTTHRTSPGFRRGALSRCCL
eukprot:385505-Pelagomonas_calceolata.AAC.1